MSEEKMIICNSEGCCCEMFGDFWELEGEGWIRGVPNQHTREPQHHCPDCALSVLKNQVKELASEINIMIDVDKRKDTIIEGLKKGETRVGDFEYE